jgi:hypothetical protein
MGDGPILPPALVVFYTGGALGNWMYLVPRTWQIDGHSDPKT